MRLSTFCGLRCDQEQKYPYKMPPNLAKFPLKNFALFLIAVRIEAGEILPHITFPFGILDRGFTI
jgi:hypothetical protein